MNWLERARREIGGRAGDPTANTAEGHPTAVLAVLDPVGSEGQGGSFGSNGSSLQARMHDAEALRDEYEERAAIMEFEGGLPREDAERAAWGLIRKTQRLH